MNHTDLAHARVPYAEVIGRLLPEEVGITKVARASLVSGMVEIVASASAEAVKQERLRVAREVHDGIAQLFVGIGRHLEQAPNAADEVICRARRLAAHGLEEARAIVHGLDAPRLHETPFVDGLREMAQSMIHAPMQLAFVAGDSWPSLPRFVEAHIYRIAQEAVSNAVKHSAARVLQLEISCTHAEASILVADDGTGFSEHDEQDACGCGLLNMRARAGAIGAALHLTTGFEWGTRILLRVAIPAAR